MKNRPAHLFLGACNKRNVQTLGSFVAFACFGFLATPTKAQNQQSLGEWVARQAWVANIQAGLSPGVRIAIHTDLDDEPGWDAFQLRTVHDENSGFDPQVSPSLGIFRVSKDRSMVEWLDPVSGEWDSLMEFIQSWQSVREDDFGQPTGAGMTEKKVGAGLSGSGNGRQLSADLDQDGRLEMVRWSPIGSYDDDSFFYLEVIDDTGEVLWTGPKDRNFENAYIFFESHFGSSFPQLLYDIDGDGTVELLAPEPQSDVSATYYRRLSWRGGSFVPLSSAPLMLDNPQSRELFWKEGNISMGTWVSQFGKVEQGGMVQARITHFDEQGKWLGGAALIRFTPRGATVAEWVHPLQENPPNMFQVEGNNDTVTSAEGQLPLDLAIRIEYSRRALDELKRAGNEVKVSLIVDQYGPQYMEEEGVAFLDRKVPIGETLRLSGLPFQNPRYQLKQGKTYKLTVMILASNPNGPVLEAYSAEGAVDWDIAGIQGRELLYRCKLNGEPGEPEMIQPVASPGQTDTTSPPATSTNKPYDPFSDVDMDQLFLR